MSYKRIELAREIRLWLTNVIVPAAILVFGMDDETRNFIKMKLHRIKNKLRAVI